jgi:hypothetical protein
MELSASVLEIFIWMMAGTLRVGSSVEECNLKAAVAAEI